MDKELKACPFCGGVPKTSHRPESEAAGGGHTAFVVCYCDGYASTAHQMGHAETVQAAIAEAVEKWNTRAQLPSQGGEAVEVVAYITRPARMTIDGWENGDEYAVIASEASDADKRYDAPLMTVAQHQRILAASAKKTGEAVATDAFVPGSLADLLFQLGEKGIGVSGGTHGEHWRVAALYTHPADQVEDDLTMVKVSRELLERLFISNSKYQFDPKTYWPAHEELRALLAKSEGANKP